MSITTFQAFRNRNYRLYFTGQSFSLIGTWMQRTSVYWLIYIQTKSTFMLGLTVFATQFPSFLFSLFGGVVSDRYNRFHVLLFTQTASMMQALLLATLVLFNHYTVWEILSISIILGVINAFDVPARQSLIYDMVDHKEDLPNAIALNSSMVNLTRLIGPALAGFVLEKLGAGTCFLFNAVSFITVIVSLLLMRFPKHIAHEHKQKVLTEFKEGLNYLRHTPAIGMVILILACMSLLVLPFTTLLPVYAKEIFKGNASTFGYLNSFIGLGAIGGTFFLASLKPGVNLKKILFINTLIFGSGLILFSHSANLPLALFFAVITGFGMMSQTTISNTIIQTNVSLEMRGRIISFFAMAYFGMLPLGGLIIGALSHYIGTPNTILAEGIAALAIPLLFFNFFRTSFQLKNKTGSA
jgi:MFS family permease